MLLMMLIFCNKEVPKMASKAERDIAIADIKQQTKAHTIPGNNSKHQTQLSICNLVAQITQQ